MDRHDALIPVRPKVVISPDDVDQPRRVEWGHLLQVRGRVSDDQVHIERQKRMHRFGSGTHDHGPALTLYSGSLSEALDIYRALDALFDGGVLEEDDG